jgi:uncharacterized damage-inducible protein DinB
MPGNVRPVTDERDGLMAYLAQQRSVLQIAAYGLTDEQARAVPTRSALSIGGLLKHVASVERSWVDIVLQRQPAAPDDPSAAMADYADAFTMGPAETLAGLIADQDAAARETEAALGSLDLGRPVPVPRDVPWFPADVEAWSVRWVLLHLIQETARHAGHADIVRESIDGATAYELMAAAEGWPATDWLTPWRPPAAADGPDASGAPAAPRTSSSDHAASPAAPAASEAQATPSPGSTSSAAAPDGGDRDRREPAEPHGKAPS